MKLYRHKHNVNQYTKNGVRLYGNYASLMDEYKDEYSWMPDTPEDPKCCIHMVGLICFPTIFIQCENKRWHGKDKLYCSQHAKQLRKEQ